MAMKNKYAYRSRISEAKIRQLVKLFSVDLTASQIAELSGVNRNTVNRYVTAFRERIARYCEAESPVKGEVEVDESYFGARRVRGIRGRGARGKTIVFGLFRACLETSAFIVTRRHVDKKRLCAAAKTREDCQTVPQRSDGQRMGACTSSPAPCFWRRSEAQNRPA